MSERNHGSLAGSCAVRLMRYAKGVSTDSTIFAGSMGMFIKHEYWKGWDDELLGHLSAPSLKDFIERPVPDGIGTTIPWVYGVLSGLAPLDAKCADALFLVDAQIKAETGRTAREWYEDAAGGDDYFWFARRNLHPDLNHARAVMLALSPEDRAVLLVELGGAA